ncbi:hypothetical protein ACROYT_G022550 [Oculina patagonica]
MQVYAKPNLEAYQHQSGETHYGEEVVEEDTDNDVVLSDGFWQKLVGATQVELEQYLSCEQADTKSLRQI